MLASSGAADSPLPVPPSPPADASDAEAPARRLLDLRGVRGAAAAEVTPIVLAGEHDLLRFTTLGGEDEEFASAPRFDRRGVERTCGRGAWERALDLVGCGMAAAANARASTSFTPA